MPPERLRKRFLSFVIERSNYRYAIIKKREKFEQIAILTETCAKSRRKQEMAIENVVPTWDVRRIRVGPPISPQTCAKNGSRTTLEPQMFHPYFAHVYERERDFRQMFVKSRFSPQGCQKIDIYKNAAKVIGHFSTPQAF